MKHFFFIFIISFFLPQFDYCPIEYHITHRSIYNIGDTLSVEDQNRIFPICNGSGDYLTGDSFSFSDLRFSDWDHKPVLVSKEQFEINKNKIIK